MNKKVTTLAILLLGAMSSTAMAQTATAVDPNNAAVTQRDINQQNRIDQGLKDGQLSTGEAARLEKGEAHTDQMEDNADKSGSMSNAEKARIEGTENRESNAINRDDKNNIHGNPNSASSKRMQNDVQRDSNQQQRIRQGEQTGSLTPNEAGQMEHAEAKDSRQQNRDGKKGYLTARNQQHIQNKENNQSAKIYAKKHNRVIKEPQQ